MDRVSRNVGNKLVIYAAQNPKRAQISFTLRRKPEIKHAASKMKFPHEKEFLRELFTIWVGALKNFRQHCPKSKKFKEYRL
jgi:hypothetical protein